MEINNMKEYDRVELIVEKEKYAKEGVHKGMDGFVTQEILMVNGLFVLTKSMIYQILQQSL